MKRKESPNIELFNKRILILLSIIPMLTLIVASNGFFMKLALIVTLLLLLLMTYMNFRNFTKVEVLIVSVNLLSLLFTLGFHSAYGNAIMFINTLLCFKLFNNISINRFTFFIVHLIEGVGLSIYLFLIERPRYSGNKIYDYFGNPINTNLISILFLCAFLHLACCIVSYVKNNRIRYPALLLLAIVYGSNVWFYEARSAMISMILFIAIIIIKREGFCYSKYKSLSTSLLVLSIIFPFLYLMIVNTIHVTTIFGKGIGTRLVVWNECIEVIKKYPILGSGNDIMVAANSTGVQTSSMHNTLLSLWKILGFIPMISFIFLCVNHLEERFDNNKNLYAQAAFLSTLPVCFFESFYTEELLYLAFLPFLIVNIKDSDKKEGNNIDKNDSLLLVRKKSKIKTNS